MSIQILKASYNRIVSSAFFLMWTVLVIAQSNPSSQKFLLTPGETFSTIINSSEIPAILVSGFDVDILEDNIQNPSLGKNQYRVEFTVNENYSGQTELGIEYFEEVGVRTFARYAKLIFDVAESQIITKHDYKSISVNSQGELIDVLNNDITTHGPLDLSLIAHQESGTAEVIDGQLSFTPKEDFMGMAYVNYVVTNAKGRTAMGTATICVLDPNYVAAEGVIELTTTYNKSVPVLLPSEGFNVDQIGELMHGSIDLLGADVFEYTPDGNETNTETFSLVDNANGLIRTVIIKIIGDDKDNLSVVDDEYYTEINNSISFDVFENDYKNDNAIISYSEGLEHLGGGNFKFTPDANYQGIKQFQYETYDGYEYNLANITIYVNNYYPENKDKYEFVTKEGTSFIINYEAPIDAFDIRIVSQPDNGNLYDLDSYVYGCGMDEGQSLIVYEPKNGFQGVDNFDLEYCINGSRCKTVNVEVEVVEKDSDCNCAGRNCVWAGDANRDGKVSISDLLTLGYHVGETGQARELITGNRWTAEFGSDWNSSQVVNGLDVKHIDANGDGIITAADVEAIDANYDNYNNLVPSEILILKNYPIDIVPSATSVDSGDWLSLDIILGSADHPVLDVHGIAYTLNLSPGFVDDSSVEVIDHSRVWLGNNSPIISLFKQPAPGAIHLGSTRTTGETVSGVGITHSVGFIVEEDLEGLRRDRSNPITILVENISFVDGGGNKYRLPDTSIEVELNASGSEDRVPLKEDLFIIPNPANNFIKLHLNGGEAIKSIEIYDVNGRLINKVSGLETNDHRLSTEGMIDGIYVAKVITENSSISKKVKVIKQ